MNYSKPPAVWLRRIGCAFPVMARRVPIGANITDRDAVVPTVSWPGLAQPSTSLPVSAPQVVDGRHKVGHDAGMSGPAKLAPMWGIPAMSPPVAPGGWRR